VIYLDNNATTRPSAAVAAAVGAALQEHWCNPSSVHRAGQAARQKLELARQSLARLIGTRARFLTITGSGTESLDLAIRGSLLAQGRIGARRTREPGALLTTPVEHGAVRELAHALEREEGVRTLWAELDTDGCVDASSVERLLAENPDTAVVSVQWANNETGAIHPVGAIERICRERRVVFHCDATQWVGRMPTAVGAAGAGGGAGGGASSEGALDPDLLTYSPHKFHGPKGVGVLYVRAGVAIRPVVHGEQELGRRGGTENVPGIVGAGLAAEEALAFVNDAEARARVGRLRDEFERGVLAAVPDARVNGPSDPARRLYNTSNIGFPRLEAEALLLLLSERGVCCSAGSACSSGSLEPSPVLRAMGVPEERAHGSLRFSLSRETTAAEVREAVGIVAECVERLRRSMTATA
jgi:cysteine desulfurase